jgi:DinB superfamily
MNRYALLIATATFAGSMYAQDAAAVVKDLQNSYNGIKANILAAAEKMPEDGYAFTPGGGARTFGAWVGHVADAQAGSCGGINAAPKQLGAAQKTSKADLMAALKESFDMCDKAYSETTPDNYLTPVMSFRGATPRVSALYGNFGHDQECYGSMAVYLRGKEMVPPSTERQQMGMKGKGGKKQ